MTLDLNALDWRDLLPAYGWTWSSNVDGTHTIALDLPDGRTITGMADTPQGALDECSLALGRERHART